MRPRDPCAIITRLPSPPQSRLCPLHHVLYLTLKMPGYGCCRRLQLYTCGTTATGTIAHFTVAFVTLPTHISFSLPLLWRDITMPAAGSASAFFTIKRATDSVSVGPTMTCN